MNKSKKGHKFSPVSAALIALTAVLTALLLLRSSSLWSLTPLPDRDEESRQITYKLPPGFSDQLVFESDSDGDPDLYFLSKAGLKKLTDNNYPDGYPLFSPDGKKILYQAMPEEEWKLFILDLETGVVERVFHEAGNFRHPCWAPDGKTIAFDTDKWGDWELASYNFKRKSLTRLTDTIGDNILSHWSPDGKTIAFSGHRFFDWHVYLLNLSTNKMKKITGRGNCRPDWSPDGKWIVYVSNNGKKYDIFLIKPDGSDSHALTDDPHQKEYDPSWSRDGKRVYFHKSTGEKRGPPHHIWVINADGSQPFQITFGNNEDLYPDVY